MAPKRRSTEAVAALGRRKRPRVGGTGSSGGSVLWQPSGRAPASPLDPKLAERDPLEFFRRLLAPLAPHDFLQSHWGRCAVAIQGPAGRVRPLVRDFMHDLNLGALLEDTPSENVHAWLRPQSADSQPALESVAVSPDSALVLWRAGAALYFRAPEELENVLVPGISAGLGAGFGAYYPGDGRPRGEIETFFAGRGHVTGWHTDFQHNFTVQLRGSKTWRFKQGPVEHCVRALTPHYKTRANYEEQMKLHLSSGPSSPDYRPPDSFFEDAEEVTLAAGAVLYHPAGIWHAVECMSDDSVSINVSLSGATWAELMSNAVQQLLWASPLLRAPIVAAGGPRTRAAAQAMLDEMRRRVETLTAEDLLPPAATEASTPRRRINVATSRLGAAMAIRPGDRFHFARLAVLVEVPQGGNQEAHSPAASSSSSDDDSDGETADRGSSEAAGPGRTGVVGAGATRIYALHLNFGNEGVASWLRLRLTVPFPLSAAVAWLQERYLEARRSEEALLQRKGAAWVSGSFLARELLEAARGAEPRARAQPPAQWARLVRLLRVLCHCGFLHKARSGAGAAARTPSRVPRRGSLRLRPRAARTAPMRSPRSARSRS